jgi:hypothetical protein
MLFGFGAWRLFTGEMLRTEFRTPEKLGPFGAVAMLTTKFLIPAGLAYLAMLYRQTGRTRQQKSWMFWNVFMVLLVGTTWGSKAGSILMCLPALLVLYWKISVRRIALFAVIAFGIMLVSYQLFDVSSDYGSNALVYLWNRATVIMGDVSWEIYYQYKQGLVFPSYAKTILQAGGDKLLPVLTGARIENFELWADYHYGMLLTQLAGAPLVASQGGFNVTGTPFSEAIIAGGMVGLGIWSVATGILVGGMYRALQHALAAARPMRTALIATYFCFNVVPFLNSGGMMTLFHLPFLMGMVAAWLFVKGLSRVNLGRALWPANHSAQ